VGTATRASSQAERRRSRGADSLRRFGELGQDSSIVSGSTTPADPIAAPAPALAACNRPGPMPAASMGTEVEGRCDASLRTAAITSA